MGLKRPGTEMSWDWNILGLKHPRAVLYTIFIILYYTQSLYKLICDWNVENSGHSGLNSLGLSCPRTESSWTELSQDWIVLDWIVLGLNCLWTESSWTELSRDWNDSDWKVLDWIVWDWNILDWIILDWIVLGLKCLGLNHLGLKRLGLKCPRTESSRTETSGLNRRDWNGRDCNGPEPLVWDSFSNGNSPTESKVEF